MRQHKHSRTHTHPILLSISVGNHVMCVFVSLGVVVFHCVHLVQSSITLFYTHALFIRLGGSNSTLESPPWWVQVHIWCDNDMRCIVLLLSLFPLHSLSLSSNPSLSPSHLYLFFSSIQKRTPYGSRQQDRNAPSNQPAARTSRTNLIVSNLHYNVTESDLYVSNIEEEGEGWLSYKEIT